jgi:transposase
MMGQHDRSEALFYYFRLEDQVPETHPLRLIEKHISFAFVGERLKQSYSETGRPSIDPELLLRILLIGYLYGITSERKLVEELGMHLAWRWFTGLGFDQEIPHHSTFSKNRHGRFQESKLFEELFEQIVRQCVEVGLVSGKNLSVDGSFVEANAAKESRIPRGQLAEAAQVHHTVRQYLRGSGRAEPGGRTGARTGSSIDHRSRFHLRDQRRHAGTARLLRQLSGGQRQLRDRGSAGHSGAHESGDGGRAKYADPFRGVARTSARIGSSRHDLRERRVLAMASRSKHHSLHADP